MYTDWLTMHAFARGMIEFALPGRPEFDDYTMLIAYYYGEELAHRLTFRLFE